GDSPGGPVRPVARELEELGHLRVAPERVNIPADGDVHTQLVAEVALAIQSTPYPGLPTWHINVRHNVGAANDLQPPLRDVPPEICRLLRIPLQKRLYKSHLVKCELILGMSLQKPQHRKDVRSTDL